MALHTLEYSFTAAEPHPRALRPWTHTGVVGSGDMEVLLSRREESDVQATVVTPVDGFAHLWQRVLADFVAETGLCGARLEINDNNATPFVVKARLHQALAEAEEANGND